MSSQNSRRRLASTGAVNDGKGRRTRTPSRAMRPVRTRVMDKYCAILFALLVPVVVASVELHAHELSRLAVKQIAPS